MSNPSCPICNHAKVGAFFSKGDHELLICDDCRHVFWRAMPGIKELASYYSNQYTGVHEQQAIQQEHRDYYRSHIVELAGFINTEIADLAIADIGCSYPVFLEEAVAVGVTMAIGVDWSAEARAYGTARGIPVITPDQMLSEIPDSSLDILRYSHTLEHLIDPVETLRSQARKVRKGGLVYITQPNIPVFRFAPSATDIHDSVWPTHLHFFSPISLVRMAAAAGLNVELLFSVTDPDVAWERYGASVDLDYAGERLSAVARTGDARRGELNNFPYYLGFNSAIYLRNGTELSSQETGTKAPLQQHLADTRRKLDGMRTMVQLLRKAACEVTAYQGGTASSPAEPESKPEPQVGHMQTEHTQAEMQKIADMTVDSLALAIRSGQLVQSPTLTIRTEHPVAFHSADHVHPRGSANDNTRHPRFVVACERYFAKPMMHLDLGCAGGGLVWDFLMAGHHSYGIEGSDYSRLNRRDFWRVIPEHLFTADITQPFALLDTARTHQMFHVITAWEVLEHLSEESLPRFCRNIRDCLRPDGMFFASVATFPDEDPATGAVWHVTVQPREWWLAKFAEHGLHEAGVEFDVLDFVRGSGNPRARDWDVRRNPEMGFHVVLRRSA